MKYYYGKIEWSWNATVIWDQFTKYDEMVKNKDYSELTEITKDKYNELSKQNKHFVCKV